MEKIENITIHRNCNYGSVLQTYATQKTFEDFGFKCETIDYIREQDTISGALKRLKYKSKKLAENPLLLFGAKILILFSYFKKEKVFNEFLVRNVNLSENKYYSSDEIKRVLPSAAAYCTGSDQIWNSFWNEGIEPAYYLDFVPKDSFCFSYASSIGETISENEKPIITALLKKYSFISVRESQSVKALLDLGIQSVTQVLDPTLYRTKEFWNGLASNKFENRKYIVTYNLHHDKKLDLFAKKLAKEKGLELFNISYNWHDIVRKGKLIWCPTVEEYLGLIRDAQYVIADSFHATVFSIQFGKKFISFYPEKASIRIKDLLSKLNLKERGTSGNPDIRDIDSVIDYNAVNQLLNKYRNEDKKYLTMVLKSINNNTWEYDMG